MKELIRVSVQYASRQQCCKTHKRPLPYLFCNTFVRAPLEFVVTLNAINLAHEAMKIARLFLKFKWRHKNTYTAW